MMMRIDIITAVPDLIKSPLNTSILHRAQEKGKVEINIHNLRDYAFNKHKQIDDKPFGGGPGMILKPEPFFECLDKLIGARKYDSIIVTTPKGKVFNQKIANRLSLLKNIIIIAGHYKEIDDRVIEDNLYMKSEPDFITRTGGERRTSNFLLWQASYSEWFFLDKMWHEFSKEDFAECIEEFKRRKRNFGG
ncbi:MAG: undecaprenyl diphosphate synthase family protein [Bacteroidetes bacterium]|nr:undecaprenyl diphosphate synthase family protein [Bacteroidota bacterium]